MSAYDLAEWTSLHPIVRQTLPYLWTTLALRVPLAVLGLLLAKHITESFQRASFGLLIVVITAFALLPPPEFFTVYRDDPNYQQQLLLALATVIIGTTIIIWHNKSVQRLSSIALSLFGCLTSAIGLYQGYMLMIGFDMPASVGIGGILTVFSLGTATVLYITKQSSRTTLFVMGTHLYRAV
ncbi:MAG: hypothetical protein GC179_02575 [Anaerolineaceae bacterium]|nr:hypothetical protein [Anaerolineaceae bacterium]